MPQEKSLEKQVEELSGFVVELYKSHMILMSVVERLQISVEKIADKVGR